MSVITGQIPAALDTAAAAPDAPVPRLTTPRSATPTRSRSGSTASTAPTRTPAAASRNTWDCSVPGSLNAADPSWNATAQKLIPASGAGNGHQGPRQDGRSAEVDGRRTIPTAATTCPPTSSAPASSTRTATTGFNVEHLRDFNNAAPQRRVRHGDAARPRRLGRPRRVPGPLRNNFGGVRRRQRRRHDLRRHRRLRRADRRRVGCAAGRGPQLLVLRQLRLAQPRQLRSGRPPLDAGLLPR